MRRTGRLRVSLRVFLFGLVGSLLVFLVVSRTGAAFLSDRNPELALLLQVNEPHALGEIARRRMEAAVLAQRSSLQAATGAEPAGQATTPPAKGTSTNVEQRSREPREQSPDVVFDTAEAEKISTAAIRAMQGAPLEVGPLRILAQLADAAGDKERKRRLLTAIVQRTKHEPLASYWLMLEAIERKDYAGVVHYADVVLSKHPSLAPHVVPALVQMAEFKSGDQELKERLKANPVWRSQFFRALPAAITDARTPLDIMLSLKGSTAPPTNVEIRDYLSFLIGRKLYEIAYYAWLQTLDPEILTQVGMVHNGGFEWTLTGAPFDWAIPRSAGATVEVRSSGEGGSKALFVELQHGRIEFQPVHQSIVLAPGHYEISLRQKGDLAGRRGLHWVLQCNETAHRLAETPMLLGPNPSWKDVRVEFTVPADGCRMQQVRLALAARSASEQLVTGSAWFDDIKIVKKTKN
jgi:hypothetical protein